MDTEKKDGRAVNGGARPGAGRKKTGKSDIINFRLPDGLGDRLRAESKRRKAAGEKSLNAEFVTWAEKKAAKINL